MSNVIRIIGGPPKPERTIADMEPGETGYTVPWAYDRKSGNLNTSYRITSGGGTACLWVECLETGKYVIEFEKSVYRNIS